MKINKSRLARLSVALVAVAALPLGLATPAQAATTKDGCTVTPRAPEFRGTFDPSNVPYVYYSADVSCVGSPSGLSVDFDLQTWEADRAGKAGDVDADGINNADEDRIGSGSTTESFGAAGGSTTVEFRGVLPHTDTDFNEEVYGKWRFRVISGPVTGKWSAYEFSPVTQIGW